MSPRQTGQIFRKRGGRILRNRQEETIGYIEHGLAIVNYAGSLFSDNAKMEIFRRTGGIVRAADSLCYRAILGAAIEKKQVIDTADIPQQAG